jgi:hypothetical protein
LKILKKKSVDLHWKLHRKKLKQMKNAITKTFSYFLKNFKLDVKVKKMRKLREIWKKENVNTLFSAFIKYNSFACNKFDISKFGNAGTRLLDQSKNWKRKEGKNCSALLFLKYCSKWIRLDNRYFNINCVNY